MVRPGITGWAQVRYQYANDLDEEIQKLRYDLYYVKYLSAAVDLRILIATVLVMLKGHPAGREAVPAVAGRRAAIRLRARIGRTQAA
jgi:lipopolysaccharide/colanic/teichoic acid biosynthesis glycosyltransferase